MRNQYTGHFDNIPQQRTTYAAPIVSTMGSEHGLVTEASLPGEPCMVRRFYYHLPTSTGGPPLPEVHGYSDIAAGDPIMVHDPFHINCSIKDEIVAFQWDHQRQRYIFVGQHGLVRRVTLIDDIPAGGTGQGTLRDAQTSMVILDIDNESDEDLEAEAVIWVNYIAGAEDLIYDATGVNVGPPEPTPIRDGKWVPISPGAAGVSHSFVFASTSIPAATFNAGNLQPGMSEPLPLYSFNGTILVPDLDNNNQPVLVTVWNSEMEAQNAEQFYRVESIDAEWFVDVGGSTSPTVFVLLQYSMPGCRLDSETGIYTPSSEPLQKLYFCNENGDIVDSGQTVTVWNGNHNIAVPPGLHEAKFIDGKLFVSPPTAPGVIKCRIIDEVKVLIDPDTEEMCTIFAVFGPGDEFAVDANEGQFEQIGVTNPAGLPGWELVCRYNYTQEAWEVISTNLTGSRDGTFAVKMTRLSGMMGDADNRCSFDYDVYGASDSDLPPRQLAHSYQPNDHNDWNDRPNIGAMTEATAGIGRYVNSEFEFKPLESICATTIDFSQFALVDIPLP